MDCRSCGFPCGCVCTAALKLIILWDDIGEIQPPRWLLKADHQHTTPTPATAAPRRPHRQTTNDTYPASAPGTASRNTWGFLVWRPKVGLFFRLSDRYSTTNRYLFPTGDTKQPVLVLSVSVGIRQFFVVATAGGQDITSSMYSTYRRAAQLVLLDTAWSQPVAQTPARHHDSYALPPRAHHTRQDDGRPFRGRQGQLGQCAVEPSVALWTGGCDMGREPFGGRWLTERTYSGGKGMTSSPRTWPSRVACSEFGSRWSDDYSK